MNRFIAVLVILVFQDIDRLTVVLGTPIFRKRSLIAHYCKDVLFDTAKSSVLFSLLALS